MISTAWRTGRLRLPALALVVWVTAAPAWAQSAGQIARSADGMVVTAHPLATSAGRRMLELGGNAADAAVAAAFAIAVVEPSMNSIGGRNQILIRAADGTVSGIDGTTQVPADYDSDTAPEASHGYATIGIPGAAAGLLKLHDRHGSLPLEAVMAPAIDYAESGFRLTAGEAIRQSFAAEDVAGYEGARGIFLHADGSARLAGEQLVQPVLARTLREIAGGGHDAFYRGSIAERIAADMERAGGFVTLGDLANYEAVDARVVRGSYRGYDLVALDVPASGSIAIQSLQIAEHFDPTELDPAEWAAVLGQAIGMSVGDLPALGTDSAAARVTSRAWAADKAQHIRLPKAASAGAGGPAAGPGPVPAASPGIPDQGHTTHLSTADADGMMVALTQTLGPNMGSKVATADLGFLYAVTLGGYLGSARPGERARSGITPFLVLRDGDPVMILGAAGGLRIISAVVQAVSRVIDDGLSLPDALAAPRVHPGLGAGGRYGFSDRLFLEADPDDGWHADEVAAFEALGFRITPQRDPGSFGRVHGIQYDPREGVWVGAADPDWEGTAEAPRELPPRTSGQPAGESETQSRRPLSVPPSGISGRSTASGSSRATNQREESTRRQSPITEPSSQRR